jgi:hypothetical protein
MSFDCSHDWREPRAADRRVKSRTLLNATLTTAVPAVQPPVNCNPTAINLNTYFQDSELTGTFVVRQTTRDQPV